MGAILPECYNEVFSFHGVGTDLSEAVQAATADAVEHFNDPTFQIANQHPAAVSTQAIYDQPNREWHYVITIVRTVNA